MPHSSHIDDLLRRNLLCVQEKIAAAATRAGRDPSEVTLVCVTKSVSTAITDRLIQLGAKDLGENRVPAAEAKIESLGSAPHWHLIGHLQANKARRALQLFPTIHSVDSVALLDRLERIASEPSAEAAGKIKKSPKLHLQVNVSAEESKFGVDEAGLEAMIERAASVKAVEIAGLMTMAPLADDPEQARPFFRRLRQLRDRLTEGHGLGSSFGALSMGMSNDYEVAIEEGSTHVRVGRALFEGLRAEDADLCRS